MSGEFDNITGEHAISISDTVIRPWDLIASAPGLPGGYKEEPVEICDPATGVATTRTFLVKASLGYAVTSLSSCAVSVSSSCYADTYVSLTSIDSPALSLYTFPAADTDTDFDNTSVADVKVSDGDSSCIKKVEFDNKKILQNDCSEVLLQADGSGGQSDDVYGFASDFTKTPETATVSIYDTRLEFECGVLVDKETVSVSIGGGGSHSHSYYDPCCEPLYLSLGFSTSNANGLSLGWPCLEWDGAKYTGLNTDPSTGTSGQYSINVHFDECGRGWTAVIEPLNTQSILGLLSPPENMADSQAAVGSFTYTGGGPQIYDYGASIGGTWYPGTSIGWHKAKDLMDCRADLLDGSAYPATGTPELNNASGSIAVLAADCPAPSPPGSSPCPYGDPNHDPTTGLCCGCESGSIQDPINLFLYPDKMMNPSQYIDLGWYTWNDPGGAYPCQWSADFTTYPSNPGLVDITIKMAYDGDGIDPYWIVTDNTMVPWNDGQGNSGTELGHINSMNWSYGGNGTWEGGSAPEVYSSKMACDTTYNDPSKMADYSGQTFTSVDGAGMDIFPDWDNSGNMYDVATIEVQ